MSDNKITASIVGASGYGGGELLRLLINHSRVEVKQVTSRKYARFPVSIVHSNFRGVSDLKFSKPNKLEECDILFLCIPHGKSQERMDYYMNIAKKVVDLGADFRLKNIQDYENWYGEHTRPELLDDFTYGLSELHRDEIKESNYVSCGGCEATCSILTLYPLYKNNLVEPTKTIIDAKIGSSASGLKPNSSTHHPERSGVVRSYKPTMHRHTAEVEQELGEFESKIKVHFSATAVEMVRGILVTAHTFLKEDLKESDLMSLYKKEYKDEPFVRIINDKMGNYRFPEPKLLEGTNYFDVSIKKDKRSNRLVAVGAIDNLTKGSAGQAVQAMNLMYGFEETTGLEFFGLHPV